eukprot:143957-Pyramimonas_sp.AAC.1
MDQPTRTLSRWRSSMQTVDGPHVLMSARCTHKLRFDLSWGYKRFVEPAYEFKDALQPTCTALLPYLTTETNLNLPRVPGPL